ncbi:MAG: hypothetical protein HN383_13315 [Verrucomicrobia bacterium]|jgi:predicted aspartyl protease|nr:hypothetical protein [Verrucomicrobiota bacterium]MBT7701660.1 hypothetical protein [Verrucomicrobiota bacterium]
MVPKRLSYPCLGDVPALFINVINARSKRKQLFQMLVDTGASHTSIPASFASSFGHDNTAPDVATTEVNGIGGKSLAYIHTLRVELIDPQAKTWAKLVSPWRSPKLPVLFIDKMDTQIGLLGRDILQRWSGIAFLPGSDAKGQGGTRSWTITIEL